MAVDPRAIGTGDQQLAAYVAAGFAVTRVALLGQQGVQLVHKGVSIAILFFGAQLVIKGEMSLGQLIDFKMLAGQVAAQIIRLGQLWTAFKKGGISGIEKA